MTSKADHVRAARQPRPHTCHWPGCEKQVKPAMWGCRKHWYTLPQSIRTAIWAAYRPGQEDDGKPSNAYLLAADEAQQWIREYLAKQERQP